MWAQMAPIQLPGALRAVLSCSCRLPDWAYCGRDHAKGLHMWLKWTARLITALKRRWAHMRQAQRRQNYSSSKRARSRATCCAGAARGRCLQHPWFEPESSCCCSWCPPSAQSLGRGSRRTPCLKTAHPRPKKPVRLADLHPCPWRAASSNH